MKILVYRQKINYRGRYSGRDPSGLRASNEGRRLDALDGWIGNRLECLASILSLLVVL